MTDKIIDVQPSAEETLPPPVVRVKICGITNKDDALAACDAGADALGFVLAPEAKKRNRYIDLEEAANIIAQLPPFVTTVAVCVNEPMERQVQILSYFDCIQYHGEETPEMIPLPHIAIKALRVASDFMIEDLDRYQARAFLLDADVPGDRGGTGKVGDWQIARNIVNADKRVILAGGLTPENVAEAVRTVQPYGVDTSSGVEATPGKKDHDRIRRFIHAAKTAFE